VYHGTADTLDTRYRQIQATTNLKKTVNQHFINQHRHLFTHFSQLKKAKMRFLVLKTPQKLAFLALFSSKST